VLSLESVKMIFSLESAQPSGQNFAPETVRKGGTQLLTSQILRILPVLSCRSTSQNVNDLHLARSIPSSSDSSPVYSMNKTSDEVTRAILKI
jgi:hypothetical protein